MIKPITIEGHWTWPMAVTAIVEKLNEVIAYINKKENADETSE